ncbi:hypothetical protein ACGFJC_54090 [Nonomuraea fuscirosea]
MTNDLIDVRTRLVSPSRLHQVAALSKSRRMDSKVAASSPGDTGSA